MLVRDRMTKNPITIEPDDFLAQALRRMRTGGFRRLPVVDGGKLVGIITERDLRAHQGYLERTKVNGVMAERPSTIDSSATLEEAARIMIQRQIGGLPVIEDGALVGIVTATDALKAFLEMMGATEGGSTRIDFILEGEEHGLTEATRIVAREGGRMLGVGTYRQKFGDNPICYLRVIAENGDNIAKALRNGGFDVLGVHRIAGYSAE
jgi:acetoin utilization protein AcuB